MDHMQFAYWLQGFAELSDAPPNPEQWKAIKDHLSTVFKKVTPVVNIPQLKEVSDKALIDRYRNYQPPTYPGQAPGQTPLKYPEVIAKASSNHGSGDFIPAQDRADEMAFLDEQLNGKR